MLAGAQVHVFGDPYYAGWGLTIDHRVLCGRTARPTLAGFFEAVFLRSARYLDPLTLAPGSLESLLDSMELQQDVARRFKDLREVVGWHFQWWKRPFVTPFLTAGGSLLRWACARSSLRTTECAALWGARSSDDLPPGSRHVRIEDGFLHSSGLGSDVVAPFSQVIDRRGIYFDSTQPSDLTTILNEADFSGTELARAAALREEIVRFGITKYNLGRCRPTWKAPGGKRTVLVLGQVAGDASLRLGSRAIDSSEALLREVRARRSDAFIVYKPHPDVLSGNRAGLIDAGRVVDVIDTAADLISLIDAADEVHTVSSLAGFDALLRGKEVFTYGLPFYAGWGLTHDAAAPVPWRERTVSLDMLIAGALLRYPIYWDWKLQRYTTPEAVVRRIASDAGRPFRGMQRSPARPFLKAARWTRNVLRHALWRFEQRMRSKTGLETQA
jgi:capsular polysaccharide export protein